MEEKTLFKLARAITDTSTDTVSSKGGTVTYRITSLKRKLVNGKVVSTSTPSCTLGSASVSWATWGGVTVGNGYLDVKINYSENTGSSRSTTLIFDQNESNNKINLTVTQGSGVIVQEYVFTGPALSSIMFLADGGTRTVEVESYILYSDGSKVAEVPYVDSKPTWVTVEITPKSQIIGNTQYSVKVTAAPNTGTTDRQENLVLRQGAVGGKELTFVVSQGIPDIKIELTITDLPTDGIGALFGESEFPNNNSSSSLGYLAFSILGTSSKFTYKKSTGLVVNSSTPGENDIAYIGDIIKLYTWNSNSTRWVFQTRFALPSSDTTISAIRS